MRMWVLEGDDSSAIAARRAELLDSEGVGVSREDVDVSVDGGQALANAVASPSLFGGPRVIAVDRIEALQADHLERIAAAAGSSDAVVVARCEGSLAAALRKKLAKIATVEAFKTPKGRDVGDRVDDLARKRGVQLTAAARKLLVDRSGHDLDRVRSVLTQLDLAGMHTPNERQVSVLLGSAGAPGVPWAVTDALERGDAAAAIRAAREVEPMIVLSWLGSQLEAAGQILDSGARSAADAAAQLGKTRFAAERPFKLASRLGRGGLRTAWQVLCDAQVRARGSLGAATALELGIARLAPLWSGRA